MFYCTVFLLSLKSILAQMEQEHVPWCGNVAMHNTYKYIHIIQYRKRIKTEENAKAAA